MAMLNNKHKLDRGAKINVENKVERKEVSRKTYATNVRVDNHIRNKMSALITLGYESSQKDLTDRLVNFFVESLSTDAQKKYKDLCNIYEDRDMSKK